MSSMAQMQIKDVTGTAFVVAQYRAEENDAAHPLYRDTIVNMFLSEESQRAADRAAAGFPLVKELVKLRTRYLDDTLDRQIAAGCRQVVVLGAGLDTRAIRKSAPGVAYFEIDDAATLTLKQARLDEHGVRANVRFISGNYVTDGMIGLLLENGFDPDLQTYVIWEGNTMYLPLGSDKAIMEQLRDNLKTFHLSFDYFAEAMIAKTTGASGLTRMAENFESMNAPWITGFDDIDVLANEVQLRVIDNFTTGDLHRAYRPAAQTPVFGPFYSICTLGSYWE
jgi:methyltransferase (TIGR00027 family)